MSDSARTCDVCKRVEGDDLIPWADIADSNLTPICHQNKRVLRQALVSISRRLVVVRERDVARQRSHDGRRMDLRVSLHPILQNIRVLHRNSETLRLTRINVLNQVLTGRRLPEEQLLPGAHGLDGATQGGRGENLAQRRRIEHRSQHTTRLGRQPQLPQTHLPDDPRVRVDLARPLGRSQRLNRPNRVRPSQRPDPRAIQEHTRLGQLLLRSR